MRNFIYIYIWVGACVSVIYLDCFRFIIIEVLQYIFMFCIAKNKKLNVGNFIALSTSPPRVSVSRQSVVSYRLGPALKIVVG
jgi:hypothetical protein